MKTFYLLTLLICFSCFVNNLKAQNTFPVLSMDVTKLAIANDTTGGLPDLTDSTIFNALMHVTLFDTTNIQEINVNLGDPGMPGNRLQHTFTWDVSGATGNGTTYSRSGYHVTLNLGNYMGLLNYEATITIKRSDNTFTDLVNFSR